MGGCILIIYFNGYIVQENTYSWGKDFSAARLPVIVVFKPRNNERILNHVHVAIQASYQWLKSGFNILNTVESVSVCSM